jgi:hypothetical protein
MRSDTQPLGESQASQASTDLFVTFAILELGVKALLTKRT